MTTEQPTTNGPRGHITCDQTQRVLSMYLDEGAKLADITATTGVPRSSIYWILQKAGKEPTRQGTRRAASNGAEIVEGMKWALERVEELARQNGVLRTQLETCTTALVKSVTNNP